MQQTSQSGIDCPASVQEELQRFCNQLKEALGDGLVSVILYGGLAKDEYEPRTSDVNVMVVLKEVTVEVLDRAVSPVQEGLRAFRLAAMVLSENDLRRSTDVFPVKFLDMKKHHRLLCGKDVLTGLSIGKDHLRLRCEQEIKNLLLRLRRFYLHRASLPEAVEITLCGAISSLLIDIGVFVELKTGAAPKAKNALVEMVSELGLDSETLRKVLALKRGELKPDAHELKRLYDDFMRTVQRAAELVDKL